MVQNPASRRPRVARDARRAPRRRLAALLASALLLGLSGCGGKPKPALAPEGVETGLASFYASSLHGRRTASGERYDQTALTAAHRSLPFGTIARITNLENGRQVEVRINDRGPFVEDRIVDVSRRAAEALDFLSAGLVRVRLEVVRVP